MVLSVMLFSATFGLAGVVTGKNQLPSTSAISFDQLQAFFGTELPDLDVDMSADGERRRLEVPDYYHEKCVFWINSARSREGLPALQRWRDFEPCSNRGAKYDARANKFHASIERGMYCDWSNYMPFAQNTCPNWFNDGSTMESCTMAMWNERDSLELDEGIEPVRRRLGASQVRCKDGRAGEYCAGHYFNLRGGKHGYNAYDRVACGFYVQGGTIWINQNFGSGAKMNAETLALPHQWVSPDDWTPETAQPYGFACGGDASTRPLKLLGDECAPLVSEYQYDDCEGEYRQDYRWAGCVSGTCDETYQGPCKDFTVGTQGNLIMNGSGEDICSKQELDEFCVDPYALNYPVGSKVWFKTREVCRKSCNTCACTIKPFDMGFTDRSFEESDEPVGEFAPVTPEPTPAPVEPTPAPVSLPTPAPVSPPTLPPAQCAKHNSRRMCAKEPRCQWGTGQACVEFTGECPNLEKSLCMRTWGCHWDTSVRPRVCVTDLSVVHV